MPIARHLRKLYRTQSWRDATAAARKRAKDRCEGCAKPNKTRIWTRTGEGRMFWRPRGHSLTWRNHEGLVLTAEEWELAKRLRLREITVVCCGAHLNHQAGDDRPENVGWFCQWCHLRHDRGHHKETRSLRKDLARPLLKEAISA